MHFPLLATCGISRAEGFPAKVVILVMYDGQHVEARSAVQRHGLLMDGTCTRHDYGN